MIKWNGVSSDDFGLIVESVPDLNRPARKYTSDEVPGRNGDLIFPQDAWQNYDQEYSFWVEKHNDQHVSLAQAHILAAEIAGWLYGPSGYCRLEDSFEPEYYRMAAVLDKTKIDNILRHIARGTLAFNCRPERWLLTGEAAVKIASSGSKINNPTKFNARPLLYVTGTAAGTVTIGDYLISITALSDYLYIDSDLMQCYRLAAENKNNTVSLEDFPLLVPGDNTVSWTGGITGVTITPRWWTL